MITPKLTENIVLDLVNSSDEFPIDFDLAWKWLGFSRKDSAKRSLSRCGFIPGIDYYVVSPPDGGGLNITYQENIENIDISLDKSDSSQQIVLNVECFKSWGMMAATQSGKEVRKYFLQCERKMKQLAANPIRTDLVIADLMENDVLASAMMGVAQIFLSLAKEKEQENCSTAATYKELAHFVSIAAHTVQSQSPEALDEEAEWTEAIKLDTQRWCSMVRDAMVAVDRRQALKVLTELNEKDPGSMFLRNFPISLAVPGYQRGDEKNLSKQAAIAASQHQERNLELLRNTPFLGGK
jgi:phage anti-repressor protein